MKWVSGWGGQMGFKRNELVSVYEGVNEGCGCISYLWLE